MARIVGRKTPHTPKVEKKLDKPAKKTRSSGRRVIIPTTPEEEPAKKRPSDASTSAMRLQYASSLDVCRSPDGRIEREQFFEDVAAHIAYKLTQEDRSLISADEEVIRNRWDEICVSIQGASISCGILENEIHDRIWVIVDELDLENEDLGYLWLATQNGKTWAMSGFPYDRPPSLQPDNPPNLHPENAPWQMSDIVDHIYKHFFVRLAVNNYDSHIEEYLSRYY